MKNIKNKWEKIDEKFYMNFPSEFNNADKYEPLKEKMKINDTKRENENHLKRQHPKEWLKITAKTGGKNE